MHGKARPIIHNGDSIFEGIESPLMVGRYHSLIVSKDNFPSELLVTSYSEEGEIMSLRHKVYDIYGLQFHPESVLTEQGYQLIQNFFNMVLSNCDKKISLDALLTQALL